ncbi:MAG: heparinase II/III family protein [Candidatus Cryptobacteroides sp.]
MKRFIFIFSLLVSAVAYGGVQHPTLLLTKDGVKEMKASLGTVPQFDKAVDELIAEADAAVVRELCVPQPVDGGGGYSHEMHKLNYYDMYACGVAWQLTGDRKYADKVREILYAYAELYPTLGYHQLGLSKSPGRIFWQTLNESVWLVHTSVAYDCVYDFLSAKDRKHLEKNLFYPMAYFIMDGTPDKRINNEIFNRMHNHGTWATSAVGMIAMVMGDGELLDKALYGSDRTGKHGGFIMQLDKLFSPDGYFTEGAYYLRYAIWPFVTFAQCIEHYRPELKIFSYRDGIILKAVDVLLQMAYDGVFCRFNDALEKGYNAQELIYAVDIAYNADKSNKALLSVARDYQNKVLVSDAGYAVAKGIHDGEAVPMVFKSAFFRDGSKGDEGGIAFMRSGREELNSLVTFKATSHGLSHGHYDKLTFAYYDNGNEIITDYGASRFLNIEAKYKGHYTKQNKSYAMTTIAHNTLVVDGKSHFGGNIDESSKYAPEIHYVNMEDKDMQVVSAIERNAAPGVVMHRTLLYADIPFLQYPLIMDIMKAESETEHQYDYPIHYNGHMISLTVPYERAMSEMKALGRKNGYQHLWVEASAKGAEGSTSYTWLTGDRMYSISTNTDPQTEVVLARIGANDPDFNLRSEPVYLLREKEKKCHTFASCIETHGKYDLQVEQSANLVHSCKGVTVLHDSHEYTVVKYDFINGNSVTVCLSNVNADSQATHSVTIPDGKTISWTGVADVLID